jgi:predicted RNA-binding protein Jag
MSSRIQKGSIKEMDYQKVLSLRPLSFTDRWKGAIKFLGFIISLRKSKYALSLETNSGSGEILWSKKEEDIDSLIELISSVMRDRNKEVRYTVNMNDYTVRDIVMGDKFKSIKDAVIATRGSISQRG